MNPSAPRPREVALGKTPQDGREPHDAEQDRPDHHHVRRHLEAKMKEVSPHDLGRAFVGDLLGAAGDLS